MELCNKSQDVRGGSECSMHLSHKAPGCSMGGRGLRRDPCLELGGGEAVTQARLSLEAAPPWSNMKKSANASVWSS